MWFDPMMTWLLKSPLHGLVSNGMLLITVTGRKTGKKYTTPVGYYDEDGILWVLTDRDRTWWRNLRNGAQVKLLLKRKPVTAFAEPTFDEQVVESQLVDYIKHIPQAARTMGIHMEHGQANPQDLARNAKERLFVKIKPLT